MKKNKILILGASGFLGKHLCKTFELDKSYIVIKQSRKKIKNFHKINFLNAEEVKKKLSQIKPKFIINAAGLTDVEACQANFKLAYDANVLVLKNLKKYLEINKNCHLIHISTDHIYSGKGPHNEKKIHILNNYALTKYLGEIEAIKCNATILRTNFIGKNLSTKKSLTDWFVDSCKSNKKIILYNDVLFSPLEINSLSKIILRIIKRRKKGVYNLGAKGGMSKSQFLRLIAKKLKLNTKNIRDTKIKNITNITVRPKDMRLNVNLFEREFNIKLPRISNEINKIYLNYV